MKPKKPTPTPFWSTVKLLWNAARLRAAARGKQQQRLMNHRKGKEAMSWGGFGVVLAFLAMAVVNALFGNALRRAVDDTSRVEVARERGGEVVSQWLAKNAKALEKTLKMEGATEKDKEKARKDFEVALRAETYSAKDRTKRQDELRALFEERGGRAFIGDRELPGIKAGSMAQTALVGWTAALVLGWWWLMLAFQGEGMELDFQRRRHPMWEWLLSHPVRPGAVFFAEMLTPVVSNPMYLAAPLFWIAYFWENAGFLGAMGGGLVMGALMAVAGACVNKTLEIVAMLRLSSRSRGAMLGIVSWLGYAAFVVGLMVMVSRRGLEAVLNGMDGLVTEWLVPRPVFWLLGRNGDGVFSLWLSLAVGAAFALVVVAGSVWLSAWSTEKGLAGGFGGRVSAPGRKSGKVLAGRDPLWRKELLWFWRDRGAVVQAVLIPLTIASVQAWNLRGLAEAAASSWNSLAGLAIMCGTYFLLVLGPRSLVSEGPALWITLTWPLGLENLLKVKARMWAWLATVIVGLILSVGVFWFRADAWKLALIGVGWYIFARGLALKTVTLVPTPTSSGETEPVSRGQRWVAMMGTLTFAIGVMSGQWSLAIVGVVFSWLTSAAIWQQFRERLPYLYDPWSEKLPPAPTLVHGMVGVLALMEGMALIGGIGSLFIRSNQWMLWTFAYGSAAVVVGAVMHRFLAGRGVHGRQLWVWSGEAAKSWFSRRYWSGEGRVDSSFFKLMGVAVLTGVVLAGVALVYLYAIRFIPGVAEMMDKQNMAMEEHRSAWIWMLILSVCLAPVAEEYLFRGLLYRALDREWGGWKALLGSAAFFAILHSPMAWPPVWLVGVACAWLFRHGGRLAPAVVLHMTYNLVLALWDR